MIIRHEISELLSLYQKDIIIFICSCLLSYGFHSMKPSRPLVEHLLWANQYTECLDIKTNCVKIQLLSPVVHGLIFCGVEKERRQIEIDTNTGKVKQNMLSAAMGTWDGFVNHRGKATTLTWGEGCIKGWIIEVMLSQSLMTSPTTCYSSFPFPLTKITISLSLGNCDPSSVSVRESPHSSVYFEGVPLALFLFHSHPTPRLSLSSSHPTIPPHWPQVVVICIESCLPSFSASSNPAVNLALSEIALTKFIEFPST